MVIIYQMCIPKNYKRLQTGISSDIFCDEERLVTDSGMDPKKYYKTRIFSYKGELEQWYSKNQSLWVDFLSFY